MSPRRIGWMVRAVLYGALIALAVALWAARPGERVLLVGETSQGEYFDMEARDDGAVHGFDTRIAAVCGDGDTIEIRWWPWDGDPVPFERDGERLEVREEWSREGDSGLVEDGWATMDAAVAGDGGSASGSITVESVFSRDGREVRRCRAGAVRWRAS